MFEALRKCLRNCGDRSFSACRLALFNVVPAAKLAQAGLCSHLDEEELPVLKELATRAKPEAKGLSGWPFVNLYVVRYALMFRDSKFPRGAPESWSVLCDPRFNGKVSIYPGGKGFYPIAQIMGGGALDEKIQ